MALSEALTDDEFDLRDEVGAQYQAALDPAALSRLVQATVRTANPPRTFNDDPPLRRAQRPDQRRDGAADPHLLVLRVS